MKMEVIYSVLILSLVLNILFFYFDTVKFIWPKIKNRLEERKTITNIAESTPEVIADRGLKILKTNKSLMNWNEPKGFTQELLLLKSKHYSKSKEYRLYNYPRAYLYYGLSEFFVKTRNKEKLVELKKVFDNFIGFKNQNTFKINRIDQLPFGLTALTLYEEFKEDKYLYFSEELYDYVIKSVGEDGIISYREGQEVVFFDTLGMFVPFLIKYNKYRENENLLELVKSQLDYYIHHGIDKESFLPAHAVHRASKVKVGSINWGRGIGWYLIALSNYYQQTGEFEKEFKGVLASLDKLKTPEGLWQQFPGSYGKFDASATTAFLYSFSFHKDIKMNRNEVLNKLKPYLGSDGSILETSGDTYGPNHYSSLFGKSEFSQGMLLLLLSQLNK